jgi:hypothetical protein
MANWFNDFMKNSKDYPEEEKAPKKSKKNYQENNKSMLDKLKDTADERSVIGIMRKRKKMLDDL